MPETYSANATDRLRTPQFQISAAEPHDLFDFEVDDLWGSLVSRDDGWVQDFMGSNTFGNETRPPPAQ